MTTNSAIYFATTDVPTVVRVIRNGLKAEKPSPAVEWLEAQIRQFELESGLIVQRPESLPLKQTDDGSNPSESTNFVPELGEF